MKRILILCLFVLMSSGKGFCTTTVFPPLQPVNQVDQVENYSNNITNLPDPFVKSQNSDYSDLNKIEQTLFGKTYSNQNISSRLSRIEKSLFSTTYPSASSAQRIDNIISNFNQINKYPNISKGELSKLETKVLSQSFPQNNPERRIERLEQQIFGAVQSGDFNSRYEALKMASKTYLKNHNFNNNYANNVQQNGLQGLMGNWGNAGVMTGFTPPINPYNFSNNYNGYANPSMSGGYNNYRGSRTDRGLGGFSYRDVFTSSGTGSGVTMLD